VAYFGQAFNDWMSAPEFATTHWHKFHVRNHPFAPYAKLTVSFSWLFPCSLRLPFPGEFVANFVLRFYYGTSFFTNSGIQNPFVTTMITSAVNVASTLPGLYLVETWGRRRLLFFGAIGMFISQMIVASAGTAFPGSTNLSAQKALVAFVCVYIFFFASTWGPIACK
jgi:hypothetical protein